MVLPSTFDCVHRRRGKDGSDDGDVSDPRINRRVALARTGTNPAVIARMPSGWAVVGDVHPVHGYTLLLADPGVPGINALALPDRSSFLHDMVTLGDALLDVTRASGSTTRPSATPSPRCTLTCPHDTDGARAPAARPVWHYDWSQARVLAPEAHEAFGRAVAAAPEARGIPVA